MTQPVGRKRANAWGLFDMHGNVWEWCSDRHELYAAAAAFDPVGSVQGGSRILRGGSFSDVSMTVRSANRYATRPIERSYSIGFRLARTYP